MENNYLYIISKQEFTSLISFGSIPYNETLLIEIKGLNKQNREDELIKAFERVAPFVGDEQYLILSLEKFPDFKLRVQDISEIIPLTKEAKIGYEQKFDSRLKFSSPIYQSVVRKIEREIDFNEKLQGAKALQTIFKLSGNSNFIEINEIHSAFLKRLDGCKSNEFQGGFFEHLYVYDRYEVFPKSDLGFLYDLGELFAHSKGKSSFVNSGYYKFLEANKEDLREKKLSELIDVFLKEESIEAIRSQLTERDFRKYIVALLFLLFKGQLLDSESLLNTSIPKIVDSILKNKIEYSIELSDALFLVGSFYGFRKFYDDLYGSMNLKIFQSSSLLTPTDIKITKNEPNDISQKNIEEKVDIEFKPKPKSSQDELVETEKVYQDLVQLFSGEKELLLSGENLKKSQVLLKSIVGKKLKQKEILDYIEVNMVSQFTVQGKRIVMKTNQGDLFNNG